MVFYIFLHKFLKHFKVDMKSKWTQFTINYVPGHFVYDLSVLLTFFFCCHSGHGVRVTTVRFQK